MANRLKLDRPMRAAAHLDASGRWHPAINNDGHMHYWPNIVVKNSAEAIARARESLEREGSSKAEWNVWPTREDTP